MKKLLVEFIGTLLFIFSIGCIVVSGNPNGALAIGVALMVMVYAGGYISGGHYNPAVSLAVYIRGKMKAGEMIQYWVVQLLGGIIGAVLSKMITGNAAAVVNAPGAGISPMLAVVAEALGTFALAYVVLHTATASGTAGNSFYGMAIGLTVYVMAVSMGGISGGAFNPAVGMGRNIADVLVGTGDTIKYIWIYLVGPLVGGGLAGIVFNVVSTEE